MKQSLYLKDDKIFIANQFHKYNEILLDNNDKNSTILIANKMYVKESYILNRTFQYVAAKKFSCGVESLNFGNNIQAAQTINHFIEDKTHDKIKNFIQSKNINNDITVMLINAIYFKSNWKHRFNKTLTTPDDFHINENEIVRVDFMNIQSNFYWSYIDELDATALEMEYANSKYSFIILLPRSQTGLSTLENRLRNFDLTKIFNWFLGRIAIDVKIPKFKAEHEIKLNNILKNVCKDSDNLLLKKIINIKHLLLLVGYDQHVRFTQRRFSRNFGNQRAIICI